LFLKEEELKKILEQKVVSATVTKQTLKEAMSKLTISETYQVKACLLQSIKKITSNQLTIKSEAPFNQWLYDYIFQDP